MRDLTEEERLKYELQCDIYDNPTERYLEEEEYGGGLAVENLNTIIGAK